MKAIILTPSFFPLLNGMTYATLNHISILKNNNISVTVITGIDFDILSCDLDDLKDVNVIKADISGSGLLWNPVKGSIHDVCEEIVKIEPNFIFVEGWYNWGINVLLALPAKYKKVVFSHGSSDLMIYGAFSFMRYLGYIWYDLCNEKKIYNAIHGLILLSSFEDQYRFRDGKIAYLNHIPTFVLPNRSLIDSISYQLDYREKMFSDYNVAVIGEMNDNKNQKHILTILDKINDKINFHLFYPSKNRYLEDFQKEINNSKRKNRILLYEGFDRVKINEFIKNNINLVLVLSKTEAQPIVVIDALSHGIPFLSTNVGCLSAFEGGIVCELRMIDFYLNKFSTDILFQKEYELKAHAFSKSPDNELEFLDFILKLK